MFAKMRRDLEAKLKQANRLIETARQAKILSDRAICAIHSEKKKEADSLLNRARLGIRKLNRDLVKCQELYATNMQINLAFQEYVEAEMVMGKALEINDLLKGFDYPDFVALNLRRKKDAVRVNMLSARARAQ